MAVAAGEGSSYETVVSARRIPTHRPQEDGAAAATAVATASRPQSVDSLPDLLAEVPGVVVTRLGGLGAFATASIRGSTAEEIRVYVDGVPLDVAAGGGVDLSSLPIGDVERVEVYRGVSPIAFGEPGLAGVISLTTRAPQDSESSLSVGYGSFGTATATARAGVRQGALRLFGGFEALHSNGDFPYVDDAGTTASTADDEIRRRQGNQLDQGAGVLRLTIDLPGRQRLSLGAMAVARRLGLPGPVRAPAHDVHLTTGRAILYARHQAAELLGGNSRLETRAFFAQSDTALDDPRGGIYLLPQRTRDSSWTFGASALATKTSLAWLRLQAIIESRTERYLPRDEFAADTARPRGGRTLANAGLEATARVNGLHLDVTPALRGELTRDQSDETKQAQSRALPSLRLSLVQHASSHLRIKLNLGRYARAPSLTELFVNNGFMRGDPALRPETGLNGDAGFELELAPRRWLARLSAVGFMAHTDDQIFWRVVRPAGALYLLPANAASARILGVESTLHVQGPFASVNAQLTFTDARVSEHGAWYPLPLRPRWQSYVRPELRSAWRAWTIRTYVEGTYTSTRPAAEHGFAWLPARFVVGAGVRIAHRDSGLALSTSATDLTNVRGNDALGYPLPGRALFASLTWTSETDCMPTSQETP